jgi:hypothetical protein
MLVFLSAAFAYEKYSTLFALNKLRKKNFKRKFNHKTSADLIAGFFY